MGRRGRSFGGEDEELEEREDEDDEDDAPLPKGWIAQREDGYGDGFVRW
jgi:hypothetical protein